MKVFLSWSGPRSKFISETLRWWLPRVIQSVKPWMSDQDISAGSRWLKDVSSELSEARLGIICVTPENQNNPWLLFEAGALSKVFDQAHVCPFLIGLTPTQLVGPLSQFQASEVSREGTLKIISTINNVFGQLKLSDFDLSENFDVWWPKFEERISQVPTINNKTPKRSQEDMLEEIISNTREQLRMETLRAEHQQHQLDKFESMIATTEEGISAQRKMASMAEQCFSNVEISRSIGTE